MENTLFAMIFLVLVPGTVLTAVCCCLQVWLSKQETRWFGLVLPVLHGVNTVIIMSAVAGMLSFSTITVGSDSVNVTNYEETQSQYIVDEIETEVTFGQIMSMIGGFFFLNIPTALYLLIYRLTKRNLSKFEELARMAVLDLE